MNIAGCCNYNPETVVMAHINTDGGKMGGKSSDLSAVHACSSCHDVMDRRVQSAEFNTHKYYYINRALIRTLTLLHSAELITVKGVKK